MIKWFKKLFSRRTDTQPMSLRRWDAAKTDRLNKGHWSPVTGNTINQDLVSYLETLRTRCEFEAANNPIVEGVVNTHVIDMVGHAGPSLQVHSDSNTYNEKLEALWRDWWSMPDMNGGLSGVDMLQLWVRLEWACGEYVVQIVNDRDAPGPIKARLMNVHPRRLQTSVQFAADAAVVMGIRRTKTGRPLGYIVNQVVDPGLFGQAVDDFREIPAADIIHGFEPVEPGQIRGIPRLASALQAIADLRDYDEQVLDAARAAADMAVVLSTKHPDAQYVEVNESVEIERRQMSTLPPGWEATQITPQQPSAQYIDYRRERLRELGRPAGMPLMIVQLDSANHNYSSARFDGQVYNRGNLARQGRFERQALNRLLNLVAREAEVGRILPARPEAVRFQWTWPVPPHVDPAKEGLAERIRLQNGTLTFSAACTAHGLDPEAVRAQRKRDREEDEKAGLEPEPWSGGGTKLGGNGKKSDRMLVTAGRLGGDNGRRFTTETQRHGE